MYEGNKINFVTQYNYFGTIIDNHLNLNENFNRSYKRASTRLRLLESHRPHLTVDATIKVYLSMIVLIMTYSSTIRIPCNDTQCKKLQSLVHRCKFIIKLTVTSISSCLNHDICTSVKICLLNKFNWDTFNNYFEIFDHEMNTRNNNHSIRLSRWNLSLLVKVFFSPVAFFRTPCHWNCGKLLIFCYLSGNWKSTSNRFSAWGVFCALFMLSLLWVYLPYDSNKYLLAPN